MNRLYQAFHQSLAMGGIFLLFLLGLALSVVLARPLMILAFPAAFALVILSLFHPRVRAWLDAPV